jgi:DNA replication protein DnaC
VDRWRAGERAGCLFFSPRPGTGKTHLAVGLLAEAVGLDRTVGFWSMANFFDELLDSYSKKNTAELMDTLLEPDVVLLDDIGAEMRSGDMVQRTYYHVLDQRLMRSRVTLATTNLTPAQIEPVLGERSYSRLRALCPETILLAGEDYRLKAARNGK